MTDPDDLRWMVAGTGTTRLDTAHARIVDLSKRLDERAEQVQSLRDMLAAEREERRVLLGPAADVHAVAKVAHELSDRSEARLLASLCREVERLSTVLAEDAAGTAPHRSRAELIAALALALGRKLEPKAGGSF